MASYLDLDAIKARLAAADAETWAERLAASAFESESKLEELYAHAPTDIAALVAEVERLQNDAITAAWLGPAIGKTWEVLFRDMTAERDQLRAKLERAKVALRTYAELPDGRWNGPDDMYEDLGETAREALREIE